MILIIGYAIIAVVALAVFAIEELGKVEEMESEWELERKAYQASLAENDVVY